MLPLKLASCAFGWGVHLKIQGGSPQAVCIVKDLNTRKHMSLVGIVMLSCSPGAIFFMFYSGLLLLITRSLSTPIVKGESLGRQMDFITRTALVTLCHHCGVNFAVLLYTLTPRNAGQAHRFGIKGAHQGWQLFCDIVVFEFLHHHLSISGYNISQT